jgi:uncharacterized delta-60 repeat protein
MGTQRGHRRQGVATGAARAATRAVGGTIAVLAAVSLAVAPSLASGATVDGTFGTGGSVTVPFGSTAGAAAVVVQPDGRIVTAGQTTVDGSTRIIATRMYATGALDPSFGSGGITTVSINGGAGMDSGAGLALQSDGKIVIAGDGNATIYGPMSFAAVRLTSDGALDPAFGNGGTATVNIGGVQSIANAVVVQSDGKLVLAGTAQMSNKEFAAARLNANGTLDQTFGTLGTTVLSPSGGAWGLALQRDGKLVLAGQADYANPQIANAQQFMAARLTSSGRVDTSFGRRGIVMLPIGGTSLGFGVAVRSDGKLVLAGIAWTDTCLNSTARLTSSGALDSSYGSRGIASVPDCNGVNGLVLDSASRAVLPAVGPSVLRINANGTPDGTFASGGILNDPVGSGGGANGAAIGPDGKIVLAGAATVGGQTEIFVSRIG